MARAGLPDLERPQHVRSHQARRRRRLCELMRRGAERMGASEDALLGSPGRVPPAAG
jgi:hypothetical protein